MHDMEIFQGDIVVLDILINDSIKVIKTRLEHGCYQRISNFA